MLPHVRLFNPKGPDRVAALRAEPAWPSQDRFTLLVSVGVSRAKLRNATLLGPFDAASLALQMAEQVEALTRRGFLPAGVEAMMTALRSDRAEHRAHAAIRLGWRREKLATMALLEAFATADFDRSSIIDALGLIGDSGAIPAARQEAEKKLLSRRRSGVEALRNLGDVEGLAAAQTRAIERLPDSLRNLATAQGSDGTTLAAALAALPEREQGLAFDTLYELEAVSSTHAVQAAIGSMEIDEPHIWRYVKSVFKRSILRRDPVTFGACAHRIERTARKTTGTDAELKSGLDGVVRKTPVFRRRTQHYMMRASWRHLRQLANHRPELYAAMAAEVLIHYDAKDASEPAGRSGSLAACHLLHRILHGRSPRFEFVRSSLTHLNRVKKSAPAPPGAREEAYPELWDESPRAYIRLLAAARLREVHEFALEAVKRAHRIAVEQASPEDIVAFLSAPHEETVDLGLMELNRRFDAKAPDLKLLLALARDGRPPVRDLAILWIGSSAPVWAKDAQLVIGLLGAADAAVREAVALHAVRELAKVEPSVRRIVAERILQVLIATEPEPGLHDGYASVAVQALLDELTPLIPVEDVIALLANGSNGSKNMAGALLGRHPEAIDSIGLTRLAALGSHEVASLRASVRVLLLRALPALEKDPTPIFDLLESDWADARTFAVDLLRNELSPSLGRDAALGLLDSTRTEVQDLGRDLLWRDIETLTSAEAGAIVERLAQHTHRNVHRVAMDLLLRMPAASVALRPALLPLFRSALFDLSPDHAVKRSILVLLREAGRHTEENGRLALPVLSAFLGTEGRQDFELVLAALVEIRLAFPALASPVQLIPGTAA